MTEEHKEKIRAGVAKAKAVRDAKKEAGPSITLHVPKEEDAPEVVHTAQVVHAQVPHQIVEKRSFQIQPGPKVLLTKEQAKAAGHYWRE